jgi:hypothetical protein
MIESRRESVGYAGKRSLLPRLGLGVLLLLCAGPAAARVPAVTSPGPTTSEDALPFDPACSWKYVSAPEGLFFTGFGYTGDERGFRIHYGDFDSSNENLDYKVEIMSNQSDCTGTLYTLRFPFHNQEDHVEIEVRDANGGLMGRLEASKGELPVLYNSVNVALPTHKLGPFVITNSMRDNMQELTTFTLLDAELLTRLPLPSRLNGVRVTNGLQEFLAAWAHETVIGQYSQLYTYFKFRRALGDLLPIERERAAGAIDQHLNEPGPIHGDPYSEEHHHVSHWSAVASAVPGSSYGGFFNGHRNYLAGLEADLRDEPASTRTPFRRVPAWDPATTIPGEFDVDIDDPNGGSDLEADYKAENICDEFRGSNSGEPFLEDGLVEMERALWADVDYWHGTVHMGVGGNLGPFKSAASTLIFHPWHTTVDTIWRNWQLCEAAWYPDLYSWDEL